jgi:hypothetical protein
MSLSKAQADADLAAIEDVVAQVKQSRIYRVAGAIAMVWGVLQLVQYCARALAPSAFAWSWIAVDVCGVAMTALMLRRALPERVGGIGLTRAISAFALFYGFGFLWSRFVGHFDAREQSVFWHTLFLFGYCLAGLWFGAGFLAIGLSLSALIFLIYLYAGAQFWLLIALVSGFGYILCGFWMRRA